MSSTEFCTQPQCLLREANTDRNQLAASIVRLLSGESLAEVTGGSPSIEAQDRCTECAARVLSGARPFPSEEELARLLDAGHWSHRRSRRRARHEERNV